MNQCRGKSIGQPIVGCDCEYCYPLLRKWYKERRDVNAPFRKKRFDFVREIIKKNIIVDDNTAFSEDDRSMNTLWKNMYGEENSLMSHQGDNIIALPKLLTRLNRYVPFDAKRLKPETIQRVRDIWNSLK